MSILLLITLIVSAIFWLSALVSFIFAGTENYKAAQYSWLIFGISVMILIVLIVIWGYILYLAQDSEFFIGLIRF